MGADVLLNDETNRVPARPIAAGRTRLGDHEVSRMGLGAMKLTGPRFLGPPADREAAVAVLHRAVELGVDHLDTSDLFGPYLVNELIREALHPYPPHLSIATRVGSRRTSEGGFTVSLSADELRQEVHDNLEHLGLDTLEVVYLRLPGVGDPEEVPLPEPFEVMAAMQAEGLVRHLALAHVTAEQVAQALGIAPVVGVQQHYNLIHREDDALVDSLAADGIAYSALEGLSYTEFFPHATMSPEQSEILDGCARRTGATPSQVVMAWLLARSPNLLLIPGATSVAQLEDNLAAASVALTALDLEELDRMGSMPPGPPPRFGPPPGARRSRI